MPFVNGATPARAAAWTLDVPASVQPAESTILPDDGTKKDESIIEPDERVLVDESDFQDNGKYRSIVKIQTCFKDKNSGETTWMMGSGWLIRPDLVVTAGHVVYDWGHHLGATTQFKCYIGYNGRDSVQSPGVQARYGKAVVTTAEWVSAVDNRPRDVAFIKVHQPFTGRLRTFSFEKTATSDRCMLGVVGYPGDKQRTSGPRPEAGAQMYEQFKMTPYDLEASKRHMLEYKVSTFGGQSGAPVLRRDASNFIAIGTHCYGGGGVDSNSGNSIGGRYGNSYNLFVGLFSLDPSTFGTPGSIKVMSTTAGTEMSGLPAASDAERGFMKALKNVARIGSQVIPVAASSGLLGPVSPLVGVAAGALLRTAAEAQNIAAEGAQEATQGLVESSVLAEAALQAVLALPDVPERQQILDKMEKNWSANVPDVDTMAMAITPLVTDCALDIALDHWDKAAGRETQEPVPEWQPSGYDEEPASSIRGQESAFMQGLLRDRRPVAGEEGWSKNLSRAVEKASQKAGGIISKTAQDALKTVATQLAKTVVDAVVVGVSAESSASVLSPESRGGQVRALLERALMADAALVALMSLPGETLEGLTVQAGDGDGAENIFSHVKRVVQRIGPVALDTAHKAVQKYAPVVLSALAESGAVPRPASRTGKRRRSLLEDLLSGTLSGMDRGASAIEVSRVQAVPVLLDRGLCALLQRREREWRPSMERRASWDSNDDCPLVMPEPPAAF